MISLITVKGELGAKMKEEEKLTKWKQEFQFGFVCNNEIIFSIAIAAIGIFLIHRATIGARWEAH